LQEENRDPPLRAKAAETTKAIIRSDKADDLI
jgi:hypothetical protein